MSDPRTTAQILVATEDKLNRRLDEIAVLKLELEDARACSRVLGAEVDRLRVDNSGFNKILTGAVAELDRLRAEKAAIEAATIERCAHLCDSFEEPHMARLIRKLAKTANETEPT